MSTTKHNFTPFVPSEKALLAFSLPNKALKLTAASAKLAGIPLETRNVISKHMAVINSYYSNLIEGNNTKPHEIRLAQQGEFALDPAKRDLQVESLAHIKVQQWLEQKDFDTDTLFTAKTIQAIHKKFYEHMPTALRELKDNEGNVVAKVIPGEWRKSLVSVGKHVPPNAADLPELVNQFMGVYNPNNYQGDKKVIAVMCAHHRLTWVHPFADGNGRVGRLFTDAALKAIGLESTGVWCLSRGLARSSDRYKQLLACADFPRQGDYDGRGLLSEKNLAQFCDYMIDSALDQVTYIADLLALDKMQTRISSYIQARNDNRVNGLGGIKQVASLILYNAFVSGKLKRSMAYELSAMPERTARRLIAQLKDEGLLMETNPRSALYWQIPEHAEPWYFPQLTLGV